MSMKGETKVASPFRSEIFVLSVPDEFECGIVAEAASSDVCGDEVDGESMLEFIFFVISVPYFCFITFG